MKSHIPGILLALLLLVMALPAHADGIIIPGPPPIEPPSFRGFPLTIKYHRVKVSIENQVATTHVDQVFINEMDLTVEGTYIFPLPEGATISEFDMWVAGEKYEGRLLTKEEARAIYESYVRRQRDPALLEYVGRGAFQASIFPIPPGEERRIELTYSEVLSLDEGLVRYRYPLDTERFSRRPIADVSISVELASREALKAIYSPSHAIAVDRDGDYRALVGYEERDSLPDRDFELYYSVADDDIGLNLLSYQPKKDEAGFFLMLVAPRVEIDEMEVVAKDVLLVLDTSGSMRGEKMEQAKAALLFVLDNLRTEDRFNIVSFSTGVRQYARGLQLAAEAARAADWVNGLEAAGGTDINRALLEALSQADSERPTILIFLTDGLPTEGVIEAEQIMDNVGRDAGENVRLFTFGLGHDVNTVLLDGIAQAHRGASAYVTPGQSIEEEVSAFYAKVSTPLLANLWLDCGAVHVEDVYPYPLPDLFAGTQLLVVGRYRQGGPAEITLSGEVNGVPYATMYEDVSFRGEGGDPFIARLWATRKIGYLLDQIRQHGKDPELVDEVVGLSLRYGVATPYTSFLVEEPVQEPLAGAPAPSAALPTVVLEREEVLQEALQAPMLAPSGADAVADAEARQRLRSASRVDEDEARAVQQVGERIFVNRSGIWVDTLFDAESMQPAEVPFGSHLYFELASDPTIARVLALGPQVVFVMDGGAYQTVAAAEGESLPAPTPPPTGSETTSDSSSQRTDFWSALLQWISRLMEALGQASR